MHIDTIVTCVKGVVAAADAVTVAEVGTQELLQAGQRGGGDGRAQVSLLGIVVRVQLLRTAEQGPNAAGRALLAEQAGDGAQRQGQKAREELDDVAAGLGKAEFVCLGVDQELHR